MSFIYQSNKDYYDQPLTEDEYNDYILPEIKEYSYPLSPKIHTRWYLIQHKKRLCTHIIKKYLIKYLTFLHRTDYDIDYISKLLYARYIKYNNYILNSKNIDSAYRSYMHIFDEHIDTYKIPDLDFKIKDVVKYYETIDNNIAICIKSLHYILNINRMYATIIKNDFKNCNYNKLKELLTPDIKKEIRELSLHQSMKFKGSLKKSEKEELLWYSEAILRYNNNYINIYRKTFYTQNADVLHLNTIIKYILAHDINAYIVLAYIANEYKNNTAITEMDTNIKNTAINILENLGYDYNLKIDKSYLDSTTTIEINTHYEDLYVEDFVGIKKELINLLKRDFEKKLKWRSKIF
jgi:hypothetical protein